MTTPSTPRKAGPLLGTGAQTSWPFTFKVFAASDIAVTIANNLGVETALVLNTDYSVSVNANQDTSPGGTVTYPLSGSPLPVGSKLTIIGNLPYDQPLDLPSGGNFSPLALENELDRLAMQIQQLRELANRSLQVPVTSSVTNVGLPQPTASNIIGWNENGDNLENYPLTELATSLAFATFRYDTFNGNGVTTQFTLSADPVTLGNLDVAISGVTQVPGTDYTLVNGVLQFTSAPANGTVILARFGEGIASGPSMDSYDVRFKQAGTDATNRTAESKLREVVSITDFGGAAGPNDNTAAMNAAAAYLNSVGGGVILIPYAGEWRMNWVCLYNNITVQGVGGSGEYNVNCIRPFVITSAAITFGDGNTIVRYCGLNDVHISGIPVAGGAALGVTQVAYNAAWGLRLRGGTVNFTANRVVVYNGRRSVSLEPSTTLPVTGVRFNFGTIRNDLTDATGARCIFQEYVSVDGYATDNKFFQTKVNGPTLGYAAVAVNSLLEVDNSYWDIKPGKGILLSGSSGLVCHNLQLDPGTNNAIVIAWDNTQTNPARFIRGILRHGGQRWENSTGNGPLPDEADSYAYKALFRDTWLSNATYFTENGDAFNTNMAIARSTAEGALYLEGAHWIPQSSDTKDLGRSNYRWFNGYINQLRPGAGTVIWTSGAGSPEGSLSAPVGSMYTRTDGGAGSTLYVKESGSGNTGWVAK